VRWYQMAAEQGNAIAQNNLGVMYDKGLGVPQDYVEAVRWYQMAAEQGNAIAQNNLGVIYDKGLGVPQDYVEAVRWYQMAAEQDNGIAQIKLGVMYQNGHGVPQNYVYAHVWFSLPRWGWGVLMKNAVEKLMTPEQLAEAQRLALRWQPGTSLDDWQ